MIKRLQWGKEFLDWWYNKGGWYDTIYNVDSVTGDSVLGEQIKKAIGPWDAPTSPYAYYFEPKFSATVQAYTIQASEVYKLIPKTTFLAEGDSMKYYETDLTGLTGVTSSSTPFNSGSAESAPTIATIEDTEPAYLVDPWETSLMSRTKATWQNDPKLDPAFIKQYHADNLPNQLDTMLCTLVDTAAGSNIESIDRIISSHDESGHTTFVNADTDGDIYWGNASILIDRSTDTDDTFGGGAGLGVSLPGAASARILDLDYIDDAMKECSKYSKRKRYIGVTGQGTLNEWQKLIDPKQRYLEGPGDYQVTLSGISTKKGLKTGFQVATYTSCGIEIPVFTTTHVANETAANRSAIVTDADIGNIYFIDLDAIEIRMAIPVSYLETPPEAMLTGDSMKTRHWFMTAGQLMATNFRAHGAVKYLKST